ncbi:DUF898 family protein [Candidatus Dojkabacteria bacterium]|nr:DUF898 family protein [Candidatus Dojkabacteria bacterium]
MKKGKIIFKGSFWDYFIKFLGLSVLTVITLGLLLPYLVYWQVKYFVDNLELEIYG